MFDGTHSLEDMLSKAVNDDVKLWGVASGLMIEFRVRGYRFFIDFWNPYPLICEARDIVWALEVFEGKDVVWG